MIKTAQQYPLYTLLSPENNIVYEVPPYQREYSWRKDQWDALFDDLLDEDAKTGHFLGTIICVNRTQDTTAQSILELIDGQQRMTTLSLMLLALYREISSRADELDDDQRSDLTTLRRMLCLREPIRPRLQLQRQNSNSDDYLRLLSEAGFELEKPPTSNTGNRRVSRALAHLAQRISIHVDSVDNPVEVLLDLFSRIKLSVLVKIEVETHSDAFVLFESLNNRGLALTPIDLIKTSVLSLADKQDVSSIDRAYAAWSRWLEAIGDDYTSQERFFRQFYNAFKTQWMLTVPGVPIATKSKLIKIYEELVRRDLERFATQMDIAAPAYGRILENVHLASGATSFDRAISDLGHAQGSPAQALLLYLSVNQARFDLSEEALGQVTLLLTRFFVRRNLTNSPPTSALDRLFMTIIERIEESPDGDIYQLVYKELFAVSASDELFLERLSGPVYEDNVAATRFILVKLAEALRTNESQMGFWSQSKTRGGKESYLWTIEHILPQGANLPDSWVDMLGGEESAARIQREHTHRLGNLTLTGYNSTLGNKSFSEKRDRRDEAGQHVGYRNGLKFNEQLASLESWGESAIVRRTEKLASDAVQLFEL